MERQKARGIPQKHMERTLRAANRAIGPVKELRFDGNTLILRFDSMNDSIATEDLDDELCRWERTHG